jgi:hypothetical protein
MKFTTHLELHSQTTRLVEGASPRPSHRSQTGFSPSPTAHPRALGPGPDPKHPLQITTRTPGKGPDFKFELLPLHSPLLRQSRLVSFPPLIDMLKFSGYPYLIRGQPKGGRPIVRQTPGAWPTGRWMKRPMHHRPKDQVSRSRHCLSGPSPRDRSRRRTLAQQAKQSLRGWQ